MNETIRHWMKAGIAAGLCLLLSGCGDKVEAPEAYTIGENSTVTLDSCLDEEEGGKLVAISAPEAEDGEKDDKEKGKDKDEGEDDKADSADKKGDEITELSAKTDGEGQGSKGSDSDEGDGEEIYTYTYEEVPTAALDRYAAVLVSEDEGFTVIDEERVPQVDLPSFEDEEGSAIFARRAVDEGFLFQVAITWTAEECNVAVSCPKGGFYDDGTEAQPEEPEPEADQIMTLIEALDYVRTMRPSDLGLEGDSMSEYNILPVQGSPLVDGAVCRHINVYKEDPDAGTNRFMGAYLIGVGRVYQLDSETRTVTQIR